MNFENKLNQKENREGIEVNNSKVKKANFLLDNMTIPNKNTIKKMVAGTLAGIAAMTAVETQDAKNYNNAQKVNLETKFTPAVQAAIEQARKQMSFEKNPDTKSIAAYLDVPIDKINEGVAYSLSSESIDIDRALNHSFNYEIPMTGDNIYLISKTAISVAEEVSEDNESEADVNMFHAFSTDTRTFTFNGIDIEPSSAEMNFTGTGATKSDAILEALEEGIGYEKGIQVAVERELTSQHETIGDNFNYNEKFVRLNSNITEGIIDHYEVISLEKNKDFEYRAKVKIIFGERPKFQLKDNIQLIDEVSKPYYEIGGDNS